MTMLTFAAAPSPPTKVQLNAVPAMLTIPFAPPMGIAHNPYSRRMIPGSSDGVAAAFRPPAHNVACGPLVSPPAASNRAFYDLALPPPFSHSTLSTVPVELDR